MNHIPVSSSFIKSVAYDVSKKMLEVKFHTGEELFKYAPVLQHEYNSMMKSPSLGQFWHQHIKSRKVDSYHHEN